MCVLVINICENRSCCVTNYVSLLPPWNDNKNEITPYISSSSYSSECTRSCRRDNSKPIRVHRCNYYSKSLLQALQLLTYSATEPWFVELRYEIYHKKYTIFVNYDDDDDANPIPIQLWDTQLSGEIQPLINIQAEQTAIKHVRSIS